MRPVIRSLSLDASPGIHLITPGLLQLNVIRHHRQLVSALTSRSKIKMPPHALSLACSARTTSFRPCSSFIGSRSANESSSSTPLLVFKALHGLLPPYLADDCQLLADTRCRQLRSSDVAACSVLWTHSSLGDRRSLFRCGWTENMQQFAYQIATTRPQP